MDYDVCAKVPIVGSCKHIDAHRAFIARLEFLRPGIDHILLVNGANASHAHF